ncbi:protein BTR1 isoform X1 [Cryptomeria japonica]|uniref:protein BTR1 isoform X1 n=1 Tax=Cryptomeria japonica TaxID=3369 RepID=UPI0025ACA957|nr:protein BTR1 isoform X1 [Cryptomeria japonica]XP_057860476.1 protein BTR1 isoform X1 [Cryptomeria japonica]
MGDALDLSPTDTPESPGSPYSMSPSDSPRRNGLIYEPSEDGNKSSSCIRFLVSNAAAGSVIGKGGATVSDFQTQSGARIQLSRTHEYFPGTTDRIVSVTGTINEVLVAANLILAKLLNEAEDTNDADEKTGQVRLILPNSVCGGIIGKGGATIKAFVEDSQASIKLSSQEQALPGINDRVVTVSGTLEQQLRAIFLIITKLAEDPNYAQYANAPLSYAGINMSGMQGIPSGYAPIAYGVANYGPTVFGGHLRNNKGLMAPLVPLRSPMPVRLPVLPTTNSTHTLVKMQVPDERVGAIVGRGGKTILEIQQISGAKIKISDRGDFVSGTTDREVLISGTVDAIQIAQRMVEQRLKSDFER